MRSILVQGEVSPAELDGVLGSVGVQRQAITTYSLGPTRVAIVLGCKYYFRSNDYLGVALVAVSDGTAQRIDVSYAGGGAGLLGFQLGAGNDLEAHLTEALSDLLRARSLRFGDAPGTAPS